MLAMVGVSIIGVGGQISVSSFGCICNKGKFNLSFIMSKFVIGPDVIVFRPPEGILVMRFALSTFTGISKELII